MSIYRPVYRDISRPISRPVYGRVNAGSVIVPIAVNSDDGYSTNGSGYTAGGGIQVGYFSDFGGFKFDPAFSFANVKMQSGVAFVTLAELVIPIVAGGGANEYDVWVEKALDPPIYDQTADPQTRTKTTARISNQDFSVIQTYRLDMTASINEMLSVGPWEYGDRINTATTWTGVLTTTSGVINEASATLELTWPSQ